MLYLKILSINLLLRNLLPYLCIYGIGKANQNTNSVTPYII